MWSPAFVWCSLFLVPSVAGAAASEGPDCPTWTKPMSVGRVDDATLTELSGIVGSQRTPGWYWVHNDSGDEARVYAIDATGRVGARFQLAGAAARDWEDLAIGPGPVAGTSYLFLGDIGDNREERRTITVWRVAEPALDGDDDGAVRQLRDATAIELLYPDRPHDAETLLVDPRDGDLYVVTKERDGGSVVYRAAAPSGSGRYDLEVAAMLRFGEAPLNSASALATGGDVAPDGSAILIRTYSSAWIWALGDADLGQALRGPPCEVPLRRERQGEAIGFAGDGSAYVTVSEGVRPTIWRWERNEPLTPGSTPGSPR